MSTLITPLSAQDIYSESSTQRFPLGQKGETGDGRVFRYCLAGGTALAVGKNQQTSAEDTQFNGMTLAANVAIAATTVTITNGTTATTLNEFREGFLAVDYGTGAGYLYKIKTNDVAVSGATLTVTLEDPIQVAITTSGSKVCLIHNPYYKVIIAPSSATGAVVGVAVYPITASYYGWVQVEGIVPVLGDATYFAVGDMVSPSNGTAGAAETGQLAQGYIGNALSTGASTYYRPVMIKI